MSTKNPSELLAKFVQFVKSESPVANGPITIAHIRQAIRKDRLTEISVWTFKELDDVEEEVASYSEETDVTSILSQAA